jgi:hypothetical protein
MSKRDAYVKKFKAQLDSWNAELDQFEAKARKAEADSKIRYQRKVKELRQMRDAAKLRLTEIQGVSEDAWEDLKEGVQSAWSSLKESFQEAKSEFERGYKEGMEKE